MESQIMAQERAMQQERFHELATLLARAVLRLHAKNPGKSQENLTSDLALAAETQLTGGNGG